MGRRVERCHLCSMSFGKKVWVKADMGRWLEGWVSKQEDLGEGQQSGGTRVAGKSWRLTLPYQSGGQKDRVIK